MGRFSVPKGKVQLHIYISEELYRRLVELVPSVYGGRRVRGAISRLVEEALTQYLRSQRPAGRERQPPEQFHATSLNNNHNGSADSSKSKLPPAERALLKIAELMYQRHFTHAITVRDLQSIIAEAAGADPKTLRKYASLLACRGILNRIELDEVKWYNPHHENKILKVNFTALQSLLNHGS